MLCTSSKTSYNVLIQISCHNLGADSIYWGSGGGGGVVDILGGA